jgi:hypothetical protein
LIVVMKRPIVVSVQGFVCTQLKDVENETNGLLTYGRDFKVNPDIIRRINESKRIEK